MGLPSDSQARYVAKRRAAGLCGYGGCPNNSEPDRFYCREHLTTKLRTLMVPRELRDELKAAAGRQQVSVGLLAETLLRRGLKQVAL